MKMKALFLKLLRLFGVDVLFLGLVEKLLLGLVKKLSAACSKVRTLLDETVNGPTGN